MAPTIGVFDSGFGGLTVLRSLIERLPNARFAFLGDMARLPYGSKSRRTIARYAAQSAQFLVNEHRAQEGPAQLHQAGVLPGMGEDRRQHRREQVGGVTGALRGRGCGADAERWEQGHRDRNHDRKRHAHHHRPGRLVRLLGGAAAGSTQESAAHDPDVGGHGEGKGQGQERAGGGQVDAVSGTGEVVGAD